MPYIFNTDYQPRAYWNTPSSARTLALVAVVSAKVNDMAKGSYCRIPGNVETLSHLLEDEMLGAAG
eukprot:1348202-Pyramimonas_sp.AAC.1